MIPAVVVLTRTSPGRAGRRRETAQGESTAPGRRRFRSSQPLDPFQNQAEDGEDHHRQHDVHHYGPVPPITSETCGCSGVDRAAVAWPSALRTDPEVRPGGSAGAGP